MEVMALAARSKGTRRDSGDPYIAWIEKAESATEAEWESLARQLGVKRTTSAEWRVQSHLLSPHVDPRCPDDRHFEVVWSTLNSSSRSTSGVLGPSERLLAAGSRHERIRILLA